MKHSSRNHRRRSWKLEPLEPRVLLAGMPVISELMAGRGNDLLDGNGQTSDWIELYNAGDVAVDLTGWYLTDEANDPDKWAFPEQTLAAGEFLLVFASGNGVPDTTGNLHTNFQLSAAGEYLALIAPDGTVADEFAGGFPEQFKGASFGRVMTSQTTPLIASGEVASVLVPTVANGGDLLDGSWTGGAAFNDGTWTAGPTGIGFGAVIGDPPRNLAPAGTASASSSGPTFPASNANDGNRLDSLAFSSTTASPYWWEVDLGGDYYLDRVEIFPRDGTSYKTVENFQLEVFNSSGTSVFSDVYHPSDSTRDKPWGTSEVRDVYGSRVRISRVDGDPNFLTFAEFEVWGRETPIGTNLAFGGIASARNERPDALAINAIDGDINGYWKQNDTTGIGNPNNSLYHSTVNEVGNWWQVDLGAAYNLDYINVFSRVDFTGNASDVTLTVLADDGTTVVSSQDIRMSGTDLGAQRYGQTVDLTDISGQFVRITSNQGGANFALALAEVEVFGDAVLSGTNPDIRTDVGAAMLDTASSAFLRIPFTVPDPAALDALVLRMKFNDGFVAYVNGQQVAAANAPGSPAWDSTATGVHGGGAFDRFTLSGPTGLSDLLNPGPASENMLAIHGLNVSTDSADFLILPELEGLAIDTGGPRRYFPVPTPGTPNDSAAENLGPAMLDLTRVFDAPADDDNLTVSATVLDAYAPTASVQLHYRVGFGAEVTLPMVDDGTGTGTFTAMIPASAAGPGEMVRWRATAVDTAGNSARFPLFIDQTAGDQSEEYYGTMVADPAAEGTLPTLFWFTDDYAASNTRAGARASVYYDGEFYDNIRVRQRGGYTAGGSQKFLFNDDHPFYVSSLPKRVEEFNLNTNGSDPAFLRQPLAFEAFRDAGVAASESFFMASQVNGAFDRVGIFIEQVDADFLDRYGFDPDGALYKFVQADAAPTFTSLSGVEKKLPEDTDFSDVQEVLDGLKLPMPGQRAAFVMDTFNVPQLINYLAIRTVTLDVDSTRKNFYLYRDTFGTGEWSMFPWDKDWTFGVGRTEAAHWHPFLGEEEHKYAGTQWSLLLDTIYGLPETRDMYLRRLRTLMDEMLKPDGTSSEELYFEPRVDARFAPAAPYLSSSAADAVQGVYDFFPPWRNNLYVTHGIGALSSGGVTTIIPAFTDGARYFVPTDDSLAGVWNGIDDPPNIADWGTGPTGVGYENNPTSATSYSDLIVTDVGTEMFNQQTSIYVRMEFQLADQAAVDAIENLYLRMKYDDGFVAYVNGQEVARANFTGTPAYDATAANRNESLNADFEPIALLDGPAQLVVGKNVLAIHGFNQTIGSSDFLLLPELVEGLPVNPDAAGIPHAQQDTPTIGFGTVVFNPASGNQGEEYIELVNNNDTAVDVSGWRIDNAVELTFQPGTVIPAGGSLFVSPDVTAFRGRGQSPTGGEGRFIQGNYRGHLSNFGETIELWAADATLVNSLTYEPDPTDAQLFLRVDEIMFNPPDLTPADRDAGYVDPDQFEFIELVNTSTDTTLNLTGVRFIDGVGFDFTGSAVTSLTPGDRVLVVRDTAAMKYRYGDWIESLIAGQYTGGLKNDGEGIKLEDATDSTVAEFTYKDGPKWPQAADGGGSSLVAISADADRNSPNAWHASVQVGGTPGEAPVPTVIGRHVYYAGSAFDTGPNTGTDGSIATGKTALLPGQTATAANFTNFSGGINGLIVDLAHAPDAASIDAADVALAIGNDEAPGAWQTIAVPTLDVRAGGGRGGSDRVVLSWSGDAPKNTWLQVSILGGAAHAATAGLPADDVFYFGNAIGEVTSALDGSLGLGLPAPPLVNAADLIAIRDNPRGVANPAAIDDPRDVDRDQYVDAVDLILARDNATSPLSRLRMIMA